MSTVYNRPKKGITNKGFKYLITSKKNKKKFTKKR